MIIFNFMMIFRFYKNEAWKNVLREVSFSTKFFHTVWQTLAICDLATMKKKPFIKNDHWSEFFYTSANPEIRGCQQSPAIVVLLFSPYLSLLRRYAFCRRAAASQRFISTPFLLDRQSHIFVRTLIFLFVE